MFPFIFAQHRRPKDFRYFKAESDIALLLYALSLIDDILCLRQNDKKAAILRPEGPKKLLRELRG
ncbi:MAG: hypothetical protein D6778_10895 [Nitrospirae bacterium]|nr:MAG: hypothetical protein D6778_10895 [Nitrospirota bacterium]